MKKLKSYLQTAKTYITERSELFVGIGVVAFLFGIVGVVVLVNHLSQPQVVYTPTRACDLLTPSEAQELLGEKINSVDKNKPEIKENVAVSKCSYTDLNTDLSQMIVAAVAVRSGINDEGTAQNKNEFTSAKAAKTSEKVPEFGENAFFNTSNGQLNVLRDHDWIVVSYGVGANPEQNTIEKVSELTRKVLPGNRA